MAGRGRRISPCTRWRGSYPRYSTTSLWEVTMSSASLGLRIVRWTRTETVFIRYKNIPRRPVTINATVAATSGSGVPSGDIALATTDTLPLHQTSAIPLANGTADALVNYFPGGTYQVTLQYAGDGTYATSTSSPVSLTVTPEPSAVTPVVNYLYIDYTTNIEHIGMVTN